MFKWFAESFEKLCTFCATMNFVVLAVIGGIVGKIVGEIFYSDYLIILFIILGLVIAFFINVMTFGFISQITEMRRSLSEIEKELCKNQGDEIFEKKMESWFCAECGIENKVSSDKCTNCGAPKSKIMV